MDSTMIATIAGSFTAAADGLKDLLIGYFPIIVGIAVAVLAVDLVPALIHKVAVATGLIYEPYTDDDYDDEVSYTEAHGGSRKPTWYRVGDD